MDETEFRDPRPFMLIADMLRKQIVDGVLQPGAPLPSITVLSGELGRSRQTITKAMAVLAAEGLIFSTPGHPYCVSRRRPLAPPAGERGAR